MTRAVHFPKIGLVRQVLEIILNRVSATQTHADALSLPVGSSAPSFMGSNATVQSERESADKKLNEKLCTVLVQLYNLIELYQKEIYNKCKFGRGDSLHTHTHTHDPVVNSSLICKTTSNRKEHLNSVNSCKDPMKGSYGGEDGL